MDYCKVTVLGRMTQDPELRYTPGGTAVASFSVAINRKYRKGNGKELVEAVTFIPVRSFGKAAENAGQHLSKGRTILVDGELRQDEWTDKETKEKRRLMYIAAQKIIYLGKSNGQPAAQQDEPADAADGDVPF